MPYDNKGNLCLPTVILSEFEPWQLDVMLEAARAGGLHNQIMLATGLSKRKFRAFLTPGDPEYMEEFEDAYELAISTSQAYWEDLARKASLGQIDKHAASTFKLAVASNFRETYREETTITHKDGNAVVPSISKDLDPVEAGRAYKQLLLESSCDGFFDD